MRILLVAVLLVGLAMTATLLAARKELTAAQAAAEDGRSALVRQDGEGAGSSFDRAGKAFGRARWWLATPPVRILDLVPVARQNVGAVRTSAQAGVLVSDAGTEIAEILDQQLAGVAALAPRGGRIPLEPLRQAAGPAERAATNLARAGELVEDADTPWLLGPVAGGVREFREQLDSAQSLTRVAAALTGQLPAFLGADEPRRYFFGAANPAELRGSGGFIGAYAILTVDDGRLSFSEFSSILDLESLPATAVDAPHADYASRYDRYGGAGYWQNINMTPDFPSAATAIEQLYERTAGELLHGTIVVTPAALEPLLEVTGPTEVPGVGPVAAEEIVALMANEAFGEFDDSDERKRILGAVAAGVFTRFLDGTPDRDPAAAGQALADAAGGGHLLAHAADPDVQAALETAGIAGELPQTDGDFLAVIGNNAAGNKVDFYTDRTVSYQATLAADGSIEAAATVTLHNTAPTSGPPAYVIGPYREGFQAGENDTIVSLYCALDCHLEEFRRDSEPAMAGGEREFGYPVYSKRVRLASGESTELSYEWTAPDVWEPDAAGGTYRLTVHGQATIRPTRLSVELILPDGVEPAAGHGMTPDGRRLTWSGEIGDSEVFEVRLRRPLSLLAADQLRGWMGTVTPAHRAATGGRDAGH